MIKKGDLVTIRNYSWTQTILNGKMVRYNNYPHFTTKYVVIEVGCCFPLEVKCVIQDSAYQNNTIIQETENGKIVFIHHGFLSPAKHSIVIDGKTVEISHESFMNLKKQLT